MKNVRTRMLIFYIALTIACFAVIIGIIAVNSKPKGTYTAAILPLDTAVLLDAGHGGLDGGATSKDGFAEAPINLNITLKARALLNFFGINASLTRCDEKSLNYSADLGPRGNKNADLNGRLKIAESMPQCDFLSIHLNKFEQAKYYGAQVFYSGNSPKSKLLAQAMQLEMREILDINNKRIAKKISDGVYLMEKIQAPAITIECGFLSNENEARLLVQDAYQTKIAVAVTAGYMKYLEGQ